jgi:Flp pilus assembly protein TadB
VRLNSIEHLITQKEIILYKNMITFEKEENSDQQESEKTHIKTKAQKEAGDLEALDKIIKIIISVFYWLIATMIALAIIILFFSFVLYYFDESYSRGVIAGGAFMILSFYLFYLTSKVKKITNYLEIRHRLNILFFIFIPFSFFMCILIVMIPIVGLIMFTIFIILLIHTTKFYKAFNYAKRNNLI